MLLPSSLQPWGQCQRQPLPHAASTDEVGLPRVFLRLFLCQAYLPGPCQGLVTNSKQ